MNIDIKKKRLIVLCILVVGAGGLLISRLINIQIVYGCKYGTIALNQSTGRTEIPAERGAIYDRTGRQLAINVIKNSLFADPADETEIRKIYTYLDRLYKQARGTARGNYPLIPDKFKWIDRNLPDELATQVMKDSIPGLYINKNLNREYPFGEVGQRLLGSTNIDGQGISGLEYSYDSILAGKAGLTDFLRDGQRTTYQLREIPIVASIPGHSIILTIDWYFQEIVEEELKAAVEKYKALEGSAIFIDCHTGEILAAADYVADGRNDPIKLRAISNVFEPGSVFKVFTAAAILDGNLARPEELINCENGAWRCGPRILHDDHRHGNLTFREVIEVSSNIGTAKMAIRLGGKKLGEIDRRFGFGQRYFIGLPGEAAGSISNPGKWSAYNTAVLAIGQAVSVTALQLAAGVSAIANGGKLYRPKVIRGLLDSNGKPIKRFEPDL
ncbi:MAG: penicillin-binding protein 2, partial [candidate division Zixibacteria bacterium]|nr:penicillin-binding protein 2 [candidate division Zixibacteria bacterium]